MMPAGADGSAGTPVVVAGGGGSSPAIGGSGGMSTSGSGGASGTGDGGSSAPAASGQDAWLMMGYDATNSYFNAKESVISTANAKMLTEKWRFTVAGIPPGSPLIADGKVFVMATGGTYAIDLETGKEVWKRTDVTGTASLAYADGFVFAHTSSTAQLYKLDAKDGKTVWGPTKTYDLTGCDGTSSPVLGGGKVVVGHSCGGLEVGAGYDAARGGVEALDAATGMKAWSYSTVNDSGENGAMVWSTVAIDVAGGTVFAGTGNNYSTAGPGSDSIHAIDLATGMRRWAKQVRANDVWSLQGVPGGDDTDFGANPILAEVGGKQVVAAGDKGAAFWQLDRALGEVQWSRADLSASHAPANGGVLMNGAFDGKFFYAVSNDPDGNKAILHKMDPTKMGADEWTKTYQEVTWGAPSLANGVLYVPINAELYVLDAASGDELTKFDATGTIAAGAAAVAQGKVVVGSGLQYPYANNAKNNNQVICYGLP